MAKPIKVGYSFNPTSLSVAVAASNREPGQLRLIEAPLPDSLQGVPVSEQPEEYARFVRETNKKFKIPDSAAGLCLPYGVALCRFLTMPRMSEKQLLINLPYEFSDFIQGHAEDYNFDYAIVNHTTEAEDMLALMAATAPKQALELYQNVLERAGVHVKLVLPPEMSLVNVARTVKDADVCFVDVGPDATRITVVHKDRVQATRQIAIGYSNFDEEAAANFGVELLKILNFYQFTYSQFPLHGIYLIGEGAASEAVLKAAEQAIDLPLLPISSMLPLGGSSTALAAGVCLGGE